MGGRREESLFVDGAGFLGSVVGLYELVSVDFDVT